MSRKKQLTANDMDIYQKMLDRAFRPEELICTCNHLRTKHMSNTGICVQCNCERFTPMGR